MKRILAITAGLAAAGAMIGGIIGATVILVYAAVTRGLGGPFLLQSLGRAGSFGAGLGAVLGPLAAWTLMRQVPLWRAIVDTAVGTTLGAIVGVTIDRLTVSPYAPLIGAVVGFAAAAIRLRVSHRSPAQRELL